MAQVEESGGYVRHPGDVLRVVIGLILLLGCCLIASSESVSAFELGVFRLVNGLPSWLYGLLWSVMQLGSLAAVFVVAGIALIARRWRMAVELLTGGLLAYYCASGLKDLIGRGRPAEMMSDVVFHGDPAQGLGFPSGHAAVSAALAAVAVPFLARRWRRWVWVLPVTVGFARILVGAHLPRERRYRPGWNHDVGGGAEPHPSFPGRGSADLNRSCLATQPFLWGQGVAKQP